MLIAPEIFRNSPSKKSNYLERDFNQKNFILDYFSVNWKNIFNLQKYDVNHSLQSFFPISIKNPIFKKYINKKDPHIKEEFYQKYKNYRNTIATLMKKSKQNYFRKYFESNINNLKNTWKGIKSRISLKNSASSSPNLLNFNNELTSDPLKIANVFNNLFSLIGKKTQSRIRFLNKNDTDYLRGDK